MKSFWCKGSEVRDDLVNIYALVQTPGAAASFSEQPEIITKSLIDSCVIISALISCTFKIVQP